MRRDKTIYLVVTDKGIPIQAFESEADAVERAKQLDRPYREFYVDPLELILKNEDEEPPHE